MKEEDKTRLKFKGILAKLDEEYEAAKSPLGKARVGSPDKLPKEEEK